MTGKQFKEAIRKSGLKQNHIANEIGINQSTLSRFLNEKEELNTGKIKRLSSLLKMNSLF
ncbi:helix-turn-helix domain-containing protein [Bacillus sp. BP-3]|uniref:helix-turn-helix domain-containing protein n=1 Tax=Bacillus sp. BP-3 TaxID=3022773 RepID=UPI00232B4A69|nr:helix-turn-helix transcriptional regulator [Bacillus sp. BP-3]MDC2866532.1 helix-turn-helix transcriptional regulator [Bacillus sp. BP-3]